MAIARVNIPTPTAPVGVADYQAQLDQITALNQAFTGRSPVDGSTIRAGTVMMVGSVLYKATSDTTITGVASLYVKITPAGATASASFVASLSGVTWNHAYGGYYDGSGNLYLFDEALAVSTGVIGSYYTLGSKLIHGNQIIADSIPVTRMEVNAKFTSNVGGSQNGTINLPSIAVGQTNVSYYTTGTGLTINTPSTGTYSWSYVTSGSLTEVVIGASGGSAVISIGFGDIVSITYTRTA